MPGFQCATIKVPLDYSRPGGKKLNLAISRLKTSTKKERRGVLLLNPGGPGVPGIDMPQQLASELPKTVKGELAWLPYLAAVRLERHGPTPPSV